MDIWRGAQDAGGRNSCYSKHVRRYQEDITRPVWRHKPHHPVPLGFSRNPTPATSATPDELNTTFIECHRRIQALRALGEYVNGYGRVLVPKILRAFPPEFCQRWIVHVKRQGLSEGSILNLMEFLSDEVDGGLIAQKIRGESTDTPNYVPSAAALHVSSKQPRSRRKDRHKDEPFCVLRGKGSLGPKI